MGTVALFLPASGNNTATKLELKGRVCTSENKGHIVTTVEQKEKDSMTVHEQLPRHLYWVGK